MSNLINFASITKKITLAIIGLFLIVFLLIHMGINLCMLLPDNHGVAFRAAANFMGTNYIVKVFEIVLFAAVILHILLGIYLWYENRKARPVRYAVSNKSKTSFMSKYMIITGSLILVFLALHLVNFYFAKIGWVESKKMMYVEDINEYINQNREQFQNMTPNAFESLIKNTDPEVFNHNIIENVDEAEIKAVMGPDFHHYEPDFYNMAKQLFKNSWAVLIYVILLGALAFHLAHAFQSAFQTLGLNHSKYMPFIKCVGYLYSALIFVGFSAIPIVMYFFS